MIPVSSYDGRPIKRVDVKIGDFEKNGVESPTSWSDKAVGIAARTYFTPNENSIYEMVFRVVVKIVDEGIKAGYFKTPEEASAYQHALIKVLLNQEASPNTPTWINIGVAGRPQGSYACLSGNSLVLTKRGLMRIKDLTDQNEKQEIFTPNGWKSGFSWSTGVKPVVKVRLNTGSEIIATPDHRFLVGSSFEEAQNLIGLPVAPFYGSADWDGDNSYSDEVLVALGFIQGDGHTNGHGWCANIGKDDADIEEYFADVPFRFQDRKVFTAYKNSKLATLADALGLKKVPLYERSLPENVFTLSPKSLAAFLKGLFSANGYVIFSRENKRVGLRATCLLQLQQVQKCLLALGIKSSIYSRKQGDVITWKNGTYQSRVSHELLITDYENIERFSQVINFVHKYKRKKLQNLLDSSFSRKTKKIVTKVVSVTPAFEEEVFDFYVNDDLHTGWVDGFAVHNCVIQGVDDNMESIKAGWVAEAGIFENGSGSGVNVSKIRAAGEPLSGGGQGSGPISLWMSPTDRIADVVKSGGRCLAPWQKIYTNEGPKEVKYLADSNERFITLSYDPPAKRYKAKWASAWKSGRKEVLRVTTDKGYFDLSFDHPIRTSDNKVVRTKDLTIGMSLFACSIDETDGYYRVHLRDGKKGKEKLHRLIAKDILNQDIDGLAVHHLDINKRNNALNNIAVLTHAEHAAVHASYVVEVGQHVFQPQELSSLNHKVISIESLGEMDVYSVEVDCPTPDDKSPESGHNFVIWPNDNQDSTGSGIVVFNSRRAAKMVVMDVDHPEIEDFVATKVRAEKMARDLQALGYDISMQGKDSQFIPFQQANNSVRVTDAFMRAVKNDEEWPLTYRVSGKVARTIKARDLWQQICSAAWDNGDPGIQFHDSINRAHTCLNDGEQRASNPCVTGDTLIATEFGLFRILDLVDKQMKVVGSDGNLHFSPKIWKTGTKPVYKLTTKSGYSIKLTEDHKVLTVNGDVKAKNLKLGDEIILSPYTFGNVSLDSRLAEFIGLAVGDGYQSSEGAIVITLSPEEELLAEYVHKSLFEYRQDFASSGRGKRKTSVNKPQNTLRIVCNTKEVREQAYNFAFLDKGSDEKLFTDNVFCLDKDSIAALLRGLFTADGTVADYGNKSQYISLDVTSLKLLEQVQILLLGFGIKSKIYKNRRPAGNSLLPDGKGGSREYPTKALHSLRISKIGRILFEKNIGFLHGSVKNERLRSLNSKISTYSEPLKDAFVRLEYIGKEDVYDLTEPFTHHFVANGIVVHNCSEYLFLDDTICTLGSVNLIKFLRDDNSFDYERYYEVCKIMATMLDIEVGFTSHPTAKIAEKNPKYRTIGLGLTNLGALLMSLGLAYDSDEGREYARHLQAIMQAAATEASQEWADKLGSYERYEANREHQIRVIQEQKNLALKDASYFSPLSKVVEQYWSKIDPEAPIRNAMLTCNAPTGCLTGDTLISTSLGLVRLDSLGDVFGNTWQDTNFDVVTDEGPKKATKFFINGKDLTRTITTTSGREITGTLKHKLKVYDPETDSLIWKRMDEIAIGDIIPTILGKMVGEPRTVNLPSLGEFYWSSNWNVRVPATMSSELAELVGYFMGDGSAHAKGLRFHVFVDDNDVTDRIVFLLKHLFNIDAKFEKGGKLISIYANSVELAKWWEACGFFKKVVENKNSYCPHIPNAILFSNDPTIYRAFMRGLFEADGTYGSFGYFEISTAHKSFAKEIQTLMLSLGFPMKLSTVPTNSNRLSFEEYYKVRVRNISYNEKFLEEIGFISARKSNACEKAATRKGKARPYARKDYIYIPLNRADELFPVGDEFRSSVLSGIRKSGRISRSLAKEILENRSIPYISDKLDFYWEEVAGNEDSGYQMTYDISVPENVTYCANGFVSHNTISLLMDCETTGIEPVIAFDAIKTLSGSGSLDVGVSACVERAFVSLRGIPGNENLSDKELFYQYTKVFETALGENAVSPEGHVLMLAALQPFVSMGQSKTVNCPNDWTPEQISDIYMLAWKTGVKCIAVYRDGCKAFQPVNAVKKAPINTYSSTSDLLVENIQFSESYPIGERKRPPKTRYGATHKFELAGEEYYITVNFYPDGQPCEIFIKNNKHGSAIGGWVDAFSIAVSMGLQYGVPIEKLIEHFRHMNFMPQGMVISDSSIKMADSPVDYIFRWLEKEGLVAPNSTAPKQVRIIPVVTDTSSNATVTVNTVSDVSYGQLTGMICPSCGSSRVRQTGTCHTCDDCGTSIGGCM